MTMMLYQSLIFGTTSYYFTDKNCAPAPTVEMSELTHTTALQHDWTQPPRSPKFSMIPAGILFLIKNGKFATEASTTPAPHHLLKYNYCFFFFTKILYPLILSGNDTFILQLWYKITGNHHWKKQNSWIHFQLFCDPHHKRSELRYLKHSVLIFLMNKWTEDQIWTESSMIDRILMDWQITEIPTLSVQGALL